MNAVPKDKHLELIQAVITRVANNSFLLKGWSVTLVSALLALAVQTVSPMIPLVALFPAGMLWGLDGYFLAEETLFRKIYERAIKPHETVDDYDLNPGKCPLACWLAGAGRPTVWTFHGTIVLMILVVLAHLCLGGPAPVPPGKS